MSYDNGYITMVLPEKFDAREFATDAYQFKPKSRKRDVRIRQRRQFDAMKKAGALTPYFRNQNVLVQQMCFSKQQASDYIIRTAGELLLRQGFTPKRVFVGRKQFMELANVALPQTFGSFDFGLDVRFQASTPKWSSDDNYSSYVKWFSFNIVVEVIPWMDGVLVI